MKPNNRDLDSMLDRWLESPPIPPTPNRTDAIVDRICQEATADKDSADSMDRQIDAWLAQHPIPETAARTQALVQAMSNAARENKRPARFALPVWTLTLGGMAATLILGILGFAFLFQQAREQDPKANLAKHEAYIQSTQVTAPAPTPPPTRTQADIPNAAPEPKTELTMLDEILYAEMRLSSNADLPDEPSWESLTYTVIQ